jgi:hypothetical protein
VKFRSLVTAGLISESSAPAAACREFGCPGLIPEQPDPALGLSGEEFLEIPGLALTRSGEALPEWESPAAGEQAMKPRGIALLLALVSGPAFAPPPVTGWFSPPMWSTRLTRRT